MAAAPPALPLLAAPHRGWFLLGHTGTLLLLGSWALQHGGALAGAAPLPAPALPAGLLHGLLLAGGALGPFTYGFLSTVIPRWQGLPAVPRAAWGPGLAAAALGQALCAAGLLRAPALLVPGLIALAGAHALALAPLVRATAGAGPAGAAHALLALSGAAAGVVALGLGAAALAIGRADLLRTAGLAAVFLQLLPIYAAVAHRMIPFFSGAAVPGLRLPRPWAPLALLVLGGAGHGLLTAQHAGALRLLPDLMAFAGAATLALRWTPWRCARPALLGVLHLGFGWVPVAFGLAVAQDLGLLLGGALFAPRAPLHALTVGAFGTLLFAMVSRVTLGHSGRPLQLDRFGLALILAFQLAVALRLLAELPAVGPAAGAAAAALWWALAAAWALRAAPILLGPRADGAPG